MSWLLSILGGGSITTWIGGIVIAAALGYVGALKYDIWSLESDVSKLEIMVQSLELDVVREQGNVKACQGVVVENNNRIQDLKDNTSNRDEIISMLSENISTFKELSEARISNIVDTPAPETCELAIAFLRKGTGK